MPHTPLFHPNAKVEKLSGRLGKLTKREASSLSSLKQLVRKQGLSLGLVRGPSEQQDVCLLRFLRAQGFEEKRALASLVSCVEWGARTGLSDIRGHPGGHSASTNAVPPGLEGLAVLGGGCDRQGRPVVIVRLRCLSRTALEACGRRALMRYFVWGIERVLKRIGESMLSSQFIIEGSCVVCDARGWSLGEVSDGALSLLQEVVEVGLSYYPERLGQLFVVNLAPGEESHLLFAARALGLGAAVDSGKLVPLTGDLPKWAPELRKVISPEHLPVDYGGTAVALSPAPVYQRPASSRGREKTSPLPKRPSFISRLGLLLAALVSGGRTSYQIGGRHALALVLLLWSLVRRSAEAGSAALGTIAAALAAREWVGVPVTVPSAKSKVPLLHDPGVLLSGRRVGVSAKGEAVVDDGVRDPRGAGVVAGGGSGAGDGGRGYSAMGTFRGSPRVEGSAMRKLSGVSLAGAKVQVGVSGGGGQSGFDRFWVMVRVQVGREGGSGASGEVREWMAVRRLVEFVALREFLIEGGCPRAEGSERDPRTWKLPPVVPFASLARRLEGYLQRLLESAESANREELRVFLAETPPSPRSVTPTMDTTLAGNPAAGTSPGAGGDSLAARGASPRRDTAPSVVTRAQHAVGSADPVGTREISRTLSAPTDGFLDRRSGSAGGACEDVAAELLEQGTARELPSLRQEIKSMFKDPGECHALKLPEREHNQWLRRANRAATAAMPSSAGTMGSSRSCSSEKSLQGYGNVNSQGDAQTGARGGEAGLGGSKEGHNGLPLMTPPESPKASGTRRSPVSSSRDAAADGKRSGLNSPRRKAGAAKEGHASPRRRDALKRFVHMVRRKGANGRRSSETGDSSVFRLLHVDVFQVPPGNHLHRVDHIVGLAGGKAQARVKQLTEAKGGSGPVFLFVVNLQLPRSFTKMGWATSVVLYWGVSLEALSGPLMGGGSGGHDEAKTFTAGAAPATAQVDRCPDSGPPSLPDLSPSVSEILPTLERELLMRYIDLPFNRLTPNVTGFSAEEAMSDSGNGSARPMPPSIVSRGSSIDSTSGSGTAGSTLPAFHGVDDDDDEGESGVLSNNDFRNMSLKVVTSVVDGLYNVRKAVDEGSPQVLSRKLMQRYFRGSHYMETDIDVGSSLAAECVVGVCLKEPCVLDLGFFLEGSRRVLGCVRVSGVDLDLAESLNPSTSGRNASVANISTYHIPGTAHVNASSPALASRTRGKASVGSHQSGGAAGPSSAGGVKGGNDEPVPLGNPHFLETFVDSAEMHDFRVRGPGYLTGGGKIEAGKPFGRLVRADLFKMEPGVDRMDNIGSVGRAAKVVRRLRKEGEFLFIVNLQVPGNPPLSMVLYYAVPVPLGGVPAPGAGGRTEAFLDLFKRFVDLGALNNPDDVDGSAFDEEHLAEAGDGGRLPGDDLRNLRFKLLPKILEGPWIVRKAVGSKPTLIAQKLTCRYFRTRSYFEADIDIGSSVVAYNTVSLAIGYAKNLVVDMGFCIQGEREEELPEVLIGVARLRKLDVLLADPLEAIESFEEDSEETEGDLEDDDEDEEDESAGRELEKAPIYVPAQTMEGRDSLGNAGSEQHSDSFLVVPAGGVPGLGPAPLTSPGLVGMFSDSRETHGLRVRGASYLTDRQKIQAGPAFGSLLRADLFRVDGSRHHLFRVDHICSYGRMRDRIAALLAARDRQFLFVVNIQIPGDQAYSVVLCWGLRLREAEEAVAAGRASREDENFLRLFRRYINLDLEGGLPTNDIRNRRLKIFPKVLQGPWVVRRAVGSPCIIGRKLTARYFRRPDYFEVDIDVGSSALATYATHLAGWYAKHISMDLAFGLQGESEGELPERLIGSVHILEPDLERAERLDD